MTTAIRWTYFNYTSNSIYSLSVLDGYEYKFMPLSEATEKIMRKESLPKPWILSKTMTLGSTTEYISFDMVWNIERSG